MIAMGTNLLNRRGFQTLELISAVAIALVVMAIGFSGFRIYNSEMPVGSVSRELTHVLGTARSMSISRNNFHAFRIDLTEGNFWVDEIPDPNDPSALPIPGGAKVLESQGVDSRVRVEGVRFGTGLTQMAGIQTLVFNPDGSADADCRIYLYEAGEDPGPDQNVYTVRVYGPTGLSKVFPRTRN